MHVTIASFEEKKGWPILRCNFARNVPMHMVFSAYKLIKFTRDFEKKICLFLQFYNV
jgi:hypothetical protein